MADILAAPGVLTSMPVDDPSQPRPYTPLSLYTSTSSGQSPDSYSPTSPNTQWSIPVHLRAQSRQLRPPKSPMYVPAVLRPTEKPKQQSPPKANRLSSNAPDAGLDLDDAAAVGDGIVSTLGMAVTDEWNEELLGPVTGPPSRNHWKPDSVSITCDDESCSKIFTLFERRHHCRRCGKIFCGDHSGHEVPLDQQVRFHPHATKHRSCNLCWSDYRTWEVARVSRSNSTNSRDSTNSSSPNIPFTGGVRTGNVQVGSLPSSRDWNWSTF